MVFPMEVLERDESTFTYGRMEELLDRLALLTRRPRRACYRIVWGAQRAYRGWSDADAWDTGAHIAYIHAEMLRRMRDNAHGYPWGLSDRHMEDTGPRRDEWVEEMSFIDSQTGYDGDDPYERWMAMLAYFETGWRGLSAAMSGGDEEDLERFKMMLPLYGEWATSLWD